MSQISFNQFKTALEAAVQQKRSSYKNVYSLTMRWGKDDTNAARDTEHFQRLLKALDVAPAEELVIQSDDPVYSITFSTAWLNLVGKAAAKLERNLVIFHYAGHGTTRAGSFVFAETSAGTRVINADRSLIQPVTGSDYLSDSNNTDVLIILDCCCAHIATRAPAIQRRTVEILAATSCDTPNARCGPENTFSAKLANEIATRRRQGHKRVDFADVFQSLKGQRVNKAWPTYAMMVGMFSVGLALNGNPTVDIASMPADYRAILSVNISKDITPAELVDLSRWIRQLPPFASVFIETLLIQPTYHSHYAGSNPEYW